MDANAIEDRLIYFAVRTIKLADALPDTPAGRHVARQLLRCGTSPAPNYAEAQGAESAADFVHKLKIALNELNESCVWLRIVSRRPHEGGARRQPGRRKSATMPIHQRFDHEVQRKADFRVRQMTNDK